MTRRMYRYVMPADDERHYFDLTNGPEHVAAQAFTTDTVNSPNDHIVEFWAEYDDTKQAHRRAFRVFWTGHELPDAAAWVGTCQRLPNGLVWHLYEVAP